MGIFQCISFSRITDRKSVFSLFCCFSFLFCRTWLTLKTADSVYALSLSVCWFWMPAWHRPTFEHFSWMEANREPRLLSLPQSFARKGFYYASWIKHLERTSAIGFDGFSAVIFRGGKHWLEIHNPVSCCSYLIIFMYFAAEQTEEGPNPPVIYKFIAPLNVRLHFWQATLSTSRDV